MLMRCSMAEIVRLPFGGLLAVGRAIVMKVWRNLSPPANLDALSEFLPNEKCALRR